MKRLVQLFLTLCMAAAMDAAAAPPNRADLPANPMWVVHLDCDALHQTYLGKYLLYQLDKPEIYSNMVAFRSIFSFDFRTQLHGLTVYGNGPAAKDNVSITYGDFDPDHLIALVGKGQDAGAITNNHHVIYSWLDKKRGPNDDAGPRNYAVIQSDRIIKGQSKEGVMAAMAVIDGIEPNLSQGKAWPELSAMGGATFIQGAARNLDFIGAGPNTALLKMSKRLKLQASETDEHLKAILTIEAGDENAARQMSIVTQGLLTLLSLQKDNPTGAKLAGRMSIKQEGAIVTVTLAMPSTELIAVIKAGTAKKEAQKPAGQ